MSAPSLPRLEPCCSAWCRCEEPPPLLQEAAASDMPVVGLRGRKCLDNMTVFNQENVEEFYEIGDELGR